MPRHALGIEIGPGCQVGRCAERTEFDENADAFDQLAARLQRLGRREAVVERGEVDLAAVDAAAVVQHFEPGLHDPAPHTEGGGRAAVRYPLPDLFNPEWKPPPNGNPSCSSPR